MKKKISREEGMRLLCFHRILQYLWPAFYRTSQFGHLTSIFFGAKNGKLPRNGIASLTPQKPELLGAYRREMRLAVENNDARLAALLAFTLGQMTAGLGLSETDRVGRVIKRSGSRGGKKAAKLRKPLQDACADLVSSELSHYAKKMGEPVSLRQFREDVLRPLIENWDTSENPTQHALSIKLRGIRKDESDGIMSSKQLKRLIRRRHTGIKLTR